MSDIPAPPWQAPPRARRAPRPALTREAIVEAALAIVAEDGADHLSMRRVADRLGVAAASLYGHVANKEELIQLLLDRVFAEIRYTPSATDDWQDAYRAWLRECRAVMRRHPGVAGLTLGRIPMGTSSLAQMDTMLGLARRAGLPDQVAAFAGDLVGLYLGAFGHEEDMAAKAPPGMTPEDFGAAFRGWLKSLPADRFPNMVALADKLTAGSVDERFEWGLEILLRGLSSYIPSSPAPAARPSRARRTRKDG